MIRKFFITLIALFIGFWWMRRQWLKKRAERAQHQPAPAKTRATTLMPCSQCGVYFEVQTPEAQRTLICPQCTISH